MKKLLLFALIAGSALVSFSQSVSSKDQKIRELLEITGSAKIGVQVSRIMLSNFKETYPSVPAAYWDSLQAKINTEQLITFIIPIYGKYYTETDVDEMILFYKTPVGKKIISSLPQIMSESMKAGQEWGEKIGTEIYDNLKREGYIKKS